MKSKVQALTTTAVLLALISPVIGAAPPAENNQDSPKIVTEQERIGNDLPMLSWESTHAKPWAAMLCIHGLSLHAGSYDAFGKRMAEMGVPMYAIDVRGFGNWQNTEKSGRLNFKAAMDDIRSALETIHQAHPDLPLILTGESMGGALALQAAAANQSLVDGLLCSVPAAKRSGTKMTEAKVAVGMLVSPNKVMKNAGKGVVKRATQDESLATLWQEDPLSRMGFSAKDLMQFAMFTKNNNSKAAEIADMPVLFLQGGQDKLIKPTGTYALFNKIASPRKDLVMLGNSEHLILEEHQFNDHVIDVISSWMTKSVVPHDDRNQQASIEPGNAQKAQGHLTVAQGFIMLEDPAAAEQHLMQVMNVAHATRFAEEANAMMLDLPQNMVAPTQGVSTRVSDEEFKTITQQDAFKNDKPSVMLFYANWVDSTAPAKEAIKKAGVTYGDKVNFVLIDADDPKNAALVKRYAIKAMPSILYLDKDNEVVGYSLGYPGTSVISARINELASGIVRQAQK